MSGPSKTAVTKAALVVATEASSQGLYTYGEDIQMIVVVALASALARIAALEAQLKDDGR